MSDWYYFGFVSLLGSYIRVRPNSYPQVRGVLLEIRPRHAGSGACAPSCGGRALRTGLSLRTLPKDSSTRATWFCLLKGSMDTLTPGTNQKTTPEKELLQEVILLLEAGGGNPSPGRGIPLHGKGNPPPGGGNFSSRKRNSLLEEGFLFQKAIGAGCGTKPTSSQ